MVRYKEAKTSVSIFTPDKIASLLTKADKPLQPFLALGALAGLRTAELQRLDWKEIDLDRGFITVDAKKAKTRQRRLVPISDSLKLGLTPCKQTSGPVCLHQRPQIAAARLAAGREDGGGARRTALSYRKVPNFIDDGLSSDYCTDAGRFFPLTFSRPMISWSLGNSMGASGSLLNLKH